MSFIEQILGTIGNMNRQKAAAMFVSLWDKLSDQAKLELANAAVAKLKDLSEEK